MDFVLPWIGPLLLVGAILIAGIYLLRAWNNRSESTLAPYNVGRQEARVLMQKNIIRALGVVVFGAIVLLVLFIMGLLTPSEVIEAEIEPIATSSPEEEIINTPEPIEPTEAQPVEDETAVSVPDTPTPITIEETPTAENTPEPTPTNVPETAVVSSGVGVWLRSAPNLEGEQLEWLLEGTELTLLEQSSQGDTFSWQEVQAPSGISGWVATDFITVPGQ
ncbi:MAG: SH3 domain-containing protein [Chloroflexota bacterium]